MNPKETERQLTYDWAANVDSPKQADPTRNLTSEILTSLGGSPTNNQTIRQIEQDLVSKVSQT